MNTPILASKKQCSGCGACAASCKTSAIKLEREQDGHYYPHIDANVCIACLLCEKVCPVLNSFVYGNNLLKSKPLKAWNNDDDQRVKSSSGGVFSALASWFIENGGYVSGAVIDKLNIRHIVSCGIEDVRKMQGSKYLQSETSDAFKIVLNLLPNHPVLFSGTGCQVAGLLCLVQKKAPKHIDNLYCVDIVCDGVPSYGLLEKTVEYLGSDDVELVSFRNKRKGWNKTPKELTLRVNGIEKNLGQSNLMIKGFNKALTSRYSCYNCKYAFTDRKSDITIADFWGLENETEGNLYKGVSLVISHSQKGQALLDNAKVQCTSVGWAMAIKSNFRLYLGEKYGFTNTWLRRNLAFMFRHCSYKQLMRCYGIYQYSRFDIIGRLMGRWYQKKNQSLKKEINNYKLILDGKSKLVNHSLG